MAVPQLFSRVGMTVSGTPGTGNITLLAAITDATNGDYFTFAQRGAANGALVAYLVSDGNNVALETAIYSTTGPALNSRATTWSKIAGTAGTTTPTLTSSAKIYSVMSEELGASLASNKFTVDSSANVAVATGRASYTGLVATNCRFPDAFNAATVKSIQARTGHVAQDDITSMQVVYTNVAGVAEAAPGATGTIKVAIEYPQSQTQAFLFSTAASGTLPNSGGVVVSDVLTLTARIPRGTKFWLRPLANCSTGVGYSTTADSANFEGCNVSATVNAVTDATASGAIAASPISYFPVAIIATTTRASVLIIGDSRVLAGDVNVWNQQSDNGALARSVGIAYAYSALSYPAETTANFVSAHAIRNAVAAYCTHIIDEYGYVDFSTAVTSATVISNKTTMAGYSNMTGKPYILTTVETATTSTDNWITLTNQTVASGMATERITYNTAVRAQTTGIPNSTNGFIEYADQTESARNSGKWKIRFDSTNTAVANGYTTDGVHNSTYSIQMVREADTIPLSLFGPAITPSDATITNRMISPGGQAFRNMDGTVDPTQAPLLASLAGTQTFTGTNIFYNAAGTRFYNLSAPTDAKYWQFTNDGTAGNLIWYLVNDAGSAATAGVTYQRSGMIPLGQLLGFGSQTVPHTGITKGEAFIRQNANRNLTSQTAIQKLFDAVSNGTITLPIGAYQFECEFALASMSSTSGSFGFGFQGTSTRTEAWGATAMKAATVGTATSPQRSWNTAANTAIATASTAVAGAARIQGTVHVTVAGTLIPSVSLGVAAVAVVQAGSWFKISPLSATSAVLSVGGPWS